MKFRRLRQQIHSFYFDANKSSDARVFIKRTTVYERARYHDLKRHHTQTIEQSAKLRYAMMQFDQITTMQETDTLRCVW